MCAVCPLPVGNIPASCGIWSVRGLHNSMFGVQEEAKTRKGLKKLPASGGEAKIAAYLKQRFFLAWRSAANGLASRAPPPIWAGVAASGKMIKIKGAAERGHVLCDLWRSRLIGSSSIHRETRPFLKGGFLASIYLGLGLFYEAAQHTLCA